MNITRLANLTATALLPIAILTAHVNAQEPEFVDRPGEAIAPIVNAALRELNTGSWTFKGRVAIEKPKTETDGFGSAMFAGLEEGETFTGAVQLHRTEADEVLLVSESRLPGVMLYERGGVSLVNTTTRLGSPLSLDALTEDLGPVLRAGPLLTWSEERAIWTEVLKRPDGDADGAETPAPTKAFSATLPVSLLTPPSPEDFDMGFEFFDPTTPKIVRAELVVRVGAEGSLQGLTLRVVRSDPMAAMQKLIEQSAVDGTLEFDPSMLEAMAQVEGPTHVYELDRSTAELGERAEQALRMFRDAVK